MTKVKKSTLIGCFVIAGMLLPAIPAQAVTSYYASHPVRTPQKQGLWCAKACVSSSGWNQSFTLQSDIADYMENEDGCWWRCYFDKDPTNCKQDKELCGNSTSLAERTDALKNKAGYPSNTYHQLVSTATIPYSSIQTIMGTHNRLYNIGIPGHAMLLYGYQIPGDQVKAWDPWDGDIFWADLSNSQSCSDCFNGASIVRYWRY